MACWERLNKSIHGLTGDSIVRYYKILKWMVCTSNWDTGGLLTGKIRHVDGLFKIWAKTTYKYGNETYVHLEQSDNNYVYSESNSSASLESNSYSY